MNGRLVAPLALDPLWLTLSADAAAGFPRDNLLDPQPKVVWRSVALALPAAVTIDIDLQQDTLVDTVALMFGNFSAAATWSIRGATAAQDTAYLANDASRLWDFAGGALPMRAGAIGQPTRHHALATGSATSLRFLRITINETGANSDGYLAIGQLIVGLRWSPGWNFEWGGGRKIADLSDVQQLDGGELSVWRKARVPTVKLTWGDLTTDELAALYDLQLELGESAPLLAIEDPDPTVPGLHERMHYGTFVSLDFYERRQVNKSRVELMIRHWL